MTVFLGSANPPREVSSLKLVLKDPRIDVIERDKWRKFSLNIYPKIFCAIQLEIYMLKDPLITVLLKPDSNSTLYNDYARK